ncbi:MAG: response regulator, partial [Chloroflexota bacterium]
MSQQSGRIMVVDDNRLNRLKLSLSLEQQGYAVGTAEDGRQALSLLRDEPYDVVLLDVLMPGMDGYETLARIKSDPDLRDIPVIVISALDETDSAVRCIENGAEDYLPKPFNPILLRARLNASLQKKRLRDLEKAYLQQEVALRQSEKLATLGRLSAGMAHELNNPAAAAQRGAEQLASTFSRLLAAERELDSPGLAPPQSQALADLASLAQIEARQPEALGVLERSDLESELETWLDERGVANASRVAPALVQMGFASGELSALAESFSPEQFRSVTEWLNCAHSIYGLASEVGQAAAHVSSIVNALKAYSYMDQAPMQSVDIHEGLESTLSVLQARLAPGIEVRRESADGLPRLDAYGSELNQVWTNLIDNAIDAMGDKGRITLRTWHDGQWAAVEIENDGPP